MPRAGALNVRVMFERLRTIDDGFGNVEDIWAPICKVWGGLQIEDGREAVKAGRMEASLGGVIRVRASELTDGVTTADRAVIAGVVWNLITRANRDQRGKFYEFKAATGVAT